MARNTPHLCAHPGCPEILLDGPGYCAEHKPRGFNWNGPALAGYQTARWRRTRDIVLARDRRRCVRCGATEQLEVHHKRHLRASDPGFYDPDECETLCVREHRTETGREGARAKQARA